MHILLVNTNPIVSRLIAWNTRGDDSIHIDEIDGKEGTPRDAYDILFIDEKCCDDKALSKHLRKVEAKEKILFSSQKENMIEGIDRVIRKPFLPSDITSILQSILELELPEKKETPLKTDENIEIFESPDIVENSENKTGSILDDQEIETIKQLLLDEGLEIEQNNESSVESGADEVKQKVTEKEKSKVKFEENLLESLIEMKPKRLKKLLAGAEVSITIKFPKEV